MTVFNISNLWHSPVRGMYIHTYIHTTDLAVSRRLEGIGKTMPAAGRAGVASSVADLVILSLDLEILNSVRRFFLPL